ncbi:uncharacterized protein LOC123674966 [Harmonia axyridis]|uniref:uncharacterized protein LOC123674966 n=1 Tax=Harmonia axyridis TaxID=115357 RepID=UPI001E278214|nr:uncharacterized protein LOC123674966 [Harmonia axyridis]
MKSAMTFLISFEIETMKRYFTNQNSKGYDVPDELDVRDRSVEDTSTLSTTASTKIRSSLSSLEASGNESWPTWRSVNAKTVAKTIHNRTDSYKLAFPLNRENLAKHKENTIPNYIRSQLKSSYIEGTNLKHPDPKPRQKLQTKKHDSFPPFYKSPVESIYAPKRANKTTDTVPKKTKSVFCKQSSVSKSLKELLNDNEEESKQRVSFSQYAQLNDRLERMENLLNNEKKLSEESSDLKKIKSESINEHPSFVHDVTYHPIADHLPRPTPAPRVRRLQIHTEILQYFVLYGVITALGIIMIAMTAFWVFVYQGGFSDLINLHIMLSMTGFIQTTQGILVIRTTKYVAKEDSLDSIWTANILHTILHSIALVVDSISIAMAYLSRSYSTPPASNMYTLHAWIGMITFAVYILIWLWSLSFFFPQLQFIPMRIAISIHVALGMTLFFTLLSSCLSGFMEEIMWSLGGTYSKFPPAGVLVNSIGVLMMVYCGVFIYILQTVKDL